jgi:hypothetical protein
MDCVTNKIIVGVKSEVLNPSNPSSLCPGATNGLGQFGACTTRICTLNLKLVYHVRGVPELFLPSFSSVTYYRLFHITSNQTVPDLK